MKKMKLIGLIIGGVLILGLLGFGITKWQKNKEYHHFLLKSYKNDKIIKRVKVGDRIKVALYYKPGKDYENGMQTSVIYDEGLTPVYEGANLKVDTESLTTYKNTVDHLNSSELEKNWVILVNDIPDKKTINFITLDFESLSKMDKEGVLAYVYFDVNEKAKDKITINFDNEKTVISNYPKFKTQDLILKVDK